MKLIRIIGTVALVAAVALCLAAPAAQAGTVTNVQTAYSVDFTETNYIANVVTGTVKSVTLKHAAAGYRNYDLVLLNLSTSAVMAVTTDGMTPSATIGRELRVYANAVGRDQLKIERVGNSGTLKLNCLGTPTDITNSVLITERWWLDTTTTTYP